MKRLAAVCGALVLTLALAEPAAADQKVRIPEFSGKDAWVAEVSTGNPHWWCWEGWACSMPIWYSGDFKYDLWLWYPNDVAAADTKPVGEDWPCKKGMARTKGTDTYASNRNFSGRVLRNKLNLDALCDYFDAGPVLYAS